MTDTPPSLPPRSLWERHFQTFIGLAMLGLAAFVLKSISEGTVASAVQTEQIRTQTEQIRTLTIRIDNLSRIAINRYTSSDAKRDFAVRDDAINRIGLRLRELEARD